MTELPTRAAIFVNTRDALDRASSALSDARDWLHSDWVPVGSELTPEAAVARSAIFRGIREAKVRIAVAQADAGRCNRVALVTAIRAGARALEYMEARTK